MENIEDTIKRLVKEAIKEALDEAKAQAEPKPKAEPKAEPKPEPKAETKPEPKPEPKAETKPEPNFNEEELEEDDAKAEPTLEEVVRGFRLYLAEHGRDAGVALLSGFDVTGKLSEPGALEVSRYAEFIKAVTHE